MSLRIVFMAELVTVAKMWKQAKCPWGINWQRKHGISIPWNITQP